MEKLKAMCKLEESGIIDTKDLQLEISKVKSQLQAEIMYYRQEKGMNTLQPGSNMNATQSFMYNQSKA